MKKINLLCLVLFLNLYSLGQITGYEDVGVIVNDNSPVSQQIGEYFRQVRNIPAKNIIHIQTVTDEVIDTNEFRNIQYQVKNYILENSLSDHLNYLVTTKGIPFDIAVDSCTFGGSTPSTFHRCSSLESELTLLFNQDSSRIINNGSVQNPYYGDTAHIENANMNLMLVSRLDGKTKQDVFNLIDRSGPGTYVNKEIGKFIFDISYEQDTNVFNLFAAKMYPAIDTLTNRGWNAIFDGDNLVPTGKENVIGFVGFIRTIFEEPLDYTWERGSFAELMISGPNVSFYDSSNYSNNLQLADLVDEGLAGGSAYIHPYFSSQATDYAIFFGRYTDDRADAYNLAESYYMAAKTLSWMNLLVGDPKTTITTIGSGGVADVSNPFVLNIYPNPASTVVNLSILSNTPTTITILVLDQLGKVHFAESHQVNIGRNHISLNIAELNHGFYFARIVNDVSGKSLTKKLLVR